MRLRRATLAAVAMSLVATLSACGSGTQAHAGDVVPARQAKQFVHARLSAIATPIGTLDVHAGKAVDTVPSSDTSDLTAQTAPSGLTYLPITWSLDTSAAKSFAKFVVSSAVPVIDLHSGGSSYRLPAPDPQEGSDSFYVLVAKGGGHPTLDVDFDGVTQTADLATGKVHAGRARGLYRLGSKPVRSTKCNITARWSAVARAPQTCEVTGPFLLPYADGKWARPGHPWIVVAVQTSLTSYTQAGTAPLSGGLYAFEGVDTTYRLGHRKPVATLASNSQTAVCPNGLRGTCNSSAALVFSPDGPARRLTMVQKYRVALVNGFNGYDGKKRETATETAVLQLHRPHWPA